VTSEENGGANTHDSETAGQPRGDSPSREHRETVSPRGTPPNALRPRDPVGQDGYGPRTTEQARTTTKDGA
jgi:hypothetical protein